METDGHVMSENDELTIDQKNLVSEIAAEVHEAQSNDIVERVAKAMVATRPTPDGCSPGDVNWAFFRELARAAIEAMREPTEGRP